MTPVETLREAARLMKERAEGATGVSHHWAPHNSAIGIGRVFCGQVLIAKTDETLSGDANNATHIAALDPTVALAIADWLDEVALVWEIADGNMCDADGDPIEFADTVDSHALKVARAYLREGE